ncbi:MAG: hypothetical protein OIN66_09330 [Candidatus Methanoperedens sp.]|nr:hypothetical protein [Candidatus Methanoperedens sp.]
MNLIKWIKELSKKKYKYRCPICGFHSDDPNEIFGHICKVHTSRRFCI